MKKLIPPILLMALLSSCAMNKNYQSRVGLKYSGQYTVKSIQGARVEFKETAGTFLIDSDTLKVNDKITINVVRAKNSNTAGRIVSNNNSISKN